MSQLIEAALLFRNKKKYWINEIISLNWIILILFYLYKTLIIYVCLWAYEDALNKARSGGSSGVEIGNQFWGWSRRVFQKEGKREIPTLLWVPLPPAWLVVVNWPGYARLSRQLCFVVSDCCSSSSYSWCVDAHSTSCEDEEEEGRGRQTVQPQK